jgi:hypothetical protein
MIPIECSPVAMRREPVPGSLRLTGDPAGCNVGYMTNELLNDLAKPRPSEDLPVPLQALWWLKKGGLALGPEWTKAHELCQQREGDRAHDLVHALVHWIEGDAQNSDYWYRRAGEHRAGRAETVEREWTRIAAALSPGTKD